MEGRLECQSDPKSWSRFASVSAREQDYLLEGFPPSAGSKRGPVVGVAPLSSGLKGISIRSSRVRSELKKIGSIITKPLPNWPGSKM